MHHLRTLFDVTTAEIEEIFTISTDLKSKLGAGQRESLYANHVLGLLFEKQSLRTRVSFETAMTQLGGNSVFLGKEAGWGGERESVEDFGRVLSQYVDILVFRGKCHKQFEELASNCDCPVINGLTDYSHPCQALADLFTLQEKHGKLVGRKLTFVGDGNNVARSLAIACGKLGVQFSIATPVGYELDIEFLDDLAAIHPSTTIMQSHDAVTAAKDADAVYTDVWASMGQESEKLARAKAFADHQVNTAVMGAAKSDAIFLHCLPAHRGEEVAADVIDSDQSRIVQQAANRMHVQKGLMHWLLSQ